MRIHSPSILYFNAVRKAGSIREAARRLNVASSAVNRQILKLEAEIGAPLFDRSVQGIKLTPAGEVLARHVVVVLQDLERARFDIDELRGARAGHVSIVAVEGACSNLLPTVIQNLREREPKVTVSVDVMGSASIPHAIASGDADIGISFALPRQLELHQLGIWRFRMGAIMAVGHPLAREVSVTLPTCLDYPLMLAGPDLSIHGLLAPLIAQLSRPVIPAVQSGSIELMHELAVRQVGIAFQTRLGLERALAAGQIVHVPLDHEGPVWSDLGVYVKTGRSMPATTDLCLQIITAEIKRREADESAQFDAAVSATS